MDCPCRTAALRIFVKSIAQIHVPLRAAPRITQQHTQAFQVGQRSRFFNHTTTPVLAAASRSLHTSCVRKSATEDAGSAGTRGGDSGSKQHVAAVTAATPATNHSPKTGTRGDDADTASFRPHKGVAGARDAGNSDKKPKKAGKDKERPDTGPDPEGGAWYQPKDKEAWMTQKRALKQKFPTGWNPRKKLSPDALVGIRLLHRQFPDEYTTEVLAQKFEVSAEAIRRILKSKWTPDPEEEVERQERWHKRGQQVWTHWAALGKKPPRKWRAEGIVRDPIWNKPRGPNHKDKDARAEAQRRLAKRMMD
ncbi:required for respiratory growth protein 9, mitochondrial [Parathielavia hyrcaniae]|uniref:Required for respiratory growth protein 9, mitochondrial n=1 Tax=Parathielavia hyrcaniae TaxID=113614 RepID=A0AAN6PX57_9PEZI|nr:required for respiratory growth protein 9, mitochondrial [Parathielavia hyrcaniae]